MGSSQTTETHGLSLWKWALVCLPGFCKSFFWFFFKVSLILLPPIYRFFCGDRNHLVLGQELFQSPTPSPRLHIKSLGSSSKRRRPPPLPRTSESDSGGTEPRCLRRFSHYTATFSCVSRLSVFFSSNKDSGHIGSGAALIHLDVILTNYISKDSISEWGHILWFHGHDLSGNTLRPGLSD